MEQVQEDPKSKANGSEPAAKDDGDPETLETLKAKLEEERKAKIEAEAKAKDLGSRLTKEQQLRAEFERFHTATLPQINKAVKSFEDKWADGPQQAVQEEVEVKTKPLATDIAQAKAAAWMAQILASNPNLHKYEARVIELGDEFPDKTYSLEGIRRLFKIAENEDRAASLEKVVKEKETEGEKRRAFTESAGSRTPSQTGQKPKLNPMQAMVAKRLGMKPEEYVEAMGRVQQIGETEWEDVGRD